MLNTNAVVYIHSLGAPRNQNKNSTIDSCFGVFRREWCTDEVCRKDETSLRNSRGFAEKTRQAYEMPEVLPKARDKPTKCPKKSSLEQSRARLSAFYM